jgi:hypothetical protein
LIAPDATFAYEVTVPEIPNVSSCWNMQFCRDDDSSLSAAEDAQLILGVTPTLMISDAGPKPNPSVSRPDVSRVRLTLISANKSKTTLAFEVDRDLMKAFDIGDVFHIARTDSGGTGLSLIRNEKLVFAVGAVSAVPLGPFVQAFVPTDLAREAEAVFQRRDPKFGLTHLPLEVRIHGESRIWFRGRRKFGGYDVWVEHGFYPFDDSTDECVAIALVGACGAIPATTSAQLLSLDELRLPHWARLL